MKNDLTPEKQQELEWDAEYPSKEYSKTIFTFSAQELRKLQSLDTIIQMGDIARVMVNNVVQQQCLPRTGTKNSPDVGILYNIPQGQFNIYVPKIWCSACQVKKASVEYLGKSYCPNCASLLKEAETAKTPLGEKKPKK